MFLLAVQQTLVLLINNAELHRSFIPGPKKEELCARWSRSTATPCNWTDTWFIQKAQKVHTEFCGKVLEQRPIGRTKRWWEFDSNNWDFGETGYKDGTLIKVVQDRVLKTQAVSFSKTVHPHTTPRTGETKKTTRCLLAQLNLKFCTSQFASCHTINKWTLHLGKQHR